MTGGPPPDDPSIPDSAVLWRRIPPGRFVENTDGTFRPESGSFKRPPSGGDVSVDLADLRGIDPATALSDHDGFGLVSVTAGQCRSVGFGVIRSPLPDNPAHAEITGVTGGAARRLALASEWVVVPTRR